MAARANQHLNSNVVLVNYHRVDLKRRISPFPEDLWQPVFYFLELARFKKKFFFLHWDIAAATNSHVHVNSKTAHQDVNLVTFI